MNHILFLFLMLNKTGSTHFATSEFSLSLITFDLFFSSRTSSMFITPKTQLAFAEWRRSTLKPMFVKRIKLGQQCIEHIYPITLTYNNKFVHSDTEHTPKEASKQYNQLDVYVNMKLRANKTGRYRALLAIRTISTPRAVSTKALFRSGLTRLSR